MNILLDTHTYIWFSGNSPELSTTVREMIENPQNVAYLSIASLWEMSIKISLGKLIINKSLQEVIADLSESGIEILPISTEHILKSALLPFHHKDPFDRIIIAQSFCEGMKLLSADSIFDQYTTERIW